MVAVVVFFNYTFSFVLGPPGLSIQGQKGEPGVEARGQYFGESSFGKGELINRFLLSFLAQYN